MHGQITILCFQAGTLGLAVSSKHSLEKIGRELFCGRFREKPGV